MQVSSSRWRGRDNCFNLLKRRIILPVSIASLIAASIAVAEITPDLLQAVAAGLSTGNIDRVVALFRYFEESVPPAEVAKDKQVLRTFFTLLLDHFGRPARFEPIHSTAASFINVYMESATADIWRNSDCVFKTYAFRTRFVQNTLRRPADVLLEACLNPRLHPIWLRRVDIHFSNPDSETIARAQTLFQRLQGEIQKIRRPTT